MRFDPDVQVRRALQVRCPHCGANVGESCTNYKGKNCAPHRDRKKARDPTSANWRRWSISQSRDRGG